MKLKARFRKNRPQPFILIYESKCPKCRILSKLIALFDIRDRIKRVPIRSTEAYDLLSEFYDHIPYTFHFIDIEEGICYSGLPVVPSVFKQLFIGFFHW